MRRRALAFAAIAAVVGLSGCGSSSETKRAETVRTNAVSHTVIETGIAGVRIGMTPERVRGVLGTPVAIRAQDTATAGSIDLTYMYPHELRVDFLRGDNGEHTAYTISTTSTFYRTVDDLGVGSTGAAAQRVAPHCVPTSDGRICTIGGVSFELRDERVFRVTVFSPPF
jgi:hypothetical protein